MTQQTDTIYATASHFDLDLPDAVIVATKLHAEAAALRDSIAAEAAPTIADVTVANLAATHKKLVSYETRDARLRAADAILNHAVANLDNAKFISTQYLRRPLRDLFTEKAAQFTQTLAEVGGTNVRLGLDNPDAWRRLQSLGSDLDALRDARDAYSPRGSRARCAHGDIFERLSLCLRVPSVKVFTQYRPKGSGVEYWADAVDFGYTLAWQDNEEQVANSQQILVPAS